MIFKFCFSAVLVYMLINEAITVDNVYDVLNFWEPLSKFDGRRNIKHKHTSETNSTKKHKETKVSAKSILRSATKSSSEQRVPDDTQTRRSRPHGRQGETAFTRIVEKTTKPDKWWWFNDDNQTNKFVLSPYSIAHQLDEITAKFPEANVSTEILGRTAEYNNIVLLKVTEKTSEVSKYFRADDDKYIDEIPEKKIIFIVHALTLMGVDRMSVFQYNYFYEKLFSYYFAHLDKFDIFLIPMANPDGYAYVMNHAKSVIWNKNLTPQNGCAGVSLDRNFDIAWNGSQNISTCSQSYPGPAPFSEPETRAVRDVLHRYSHKIVAYMHLHCGTYTPTSFKGDAVLYPKGFSDAQSDDDKYIDLKSEIDEAMKNASFKYMSVTVDTLHNWYGKVLGTSVDYAATVYGVPYALEMVMQIYEPDSFTVAPPTSEELGMTALQEIWGRIIDVTFTSIWKSLNSNDVR